MDLGIPAKPEVSDECIMFIFGLLNRDTEWRTGNTYCSEVIEHSWFDDIDWRELKAKRVEPPFKPDEEMIPEEEMMPVDKFSVFVREDNKDDFLSTDEREKTREPKDDEMLELR